MRIVSTLLAFATFFLVSCQKERDFTNTASGGTGNTGSDGLLVKTVVRDGSDSMVTTYGYDSNKRLSSLNKKGIDDQGNTVNAEYHFHRNASGIITDYSATDPTLIAAGIDSIKTIVHYSSSRYTSYVLSINVPGFVVLDSSVFVYDGTGRIVGENFYQSPSGIGNDYYLSGKINYSYLSSGNLSGFVIHDYDQSGTEVFTAYASNMTYDAKINPIHLGNEAFALGHPEWVSSNNILSEQNSDSGGPADDQSVTYAYTYNANNKPATGTITIMPDNTVGNTTYYYQ
ncbi:MAG: hypothetical protein E6H10_18190 [Bacteroidetes bacterium]|nr:MAG: hypothetical protein E6H10_18190 [Bacteroidota bacterium]